MSAQPFFSPKQRTLISAALSFLAIVLLAILSVLVLTWVKQVLTFFSLVLWPLVIAGVLALMLRPLVSFIENRTPLQRTGSIITLYVLLGIFLIACAALIIPQAIRQVSQFIDNLPAIIANSKIFITTYIPVVKDKIEPFLSPETLESIKNSLFSAGDQISSTLRLGAENVLEKTSSLISMLTAAAIIPLYLFYFLEMNRNLGNDLNQQLTFIPQKIRDDATFLGQEFANILVSFFRGQLLIASIMGILMAIGFTLGGLQFGIILGLSLGLANVVPYLGIILSIGTAIPMAYLQPDGGPVLLAIVIGTILLVQIIEGYLLTPKIMGKQTGLHPMVILFSVFFWGTALDGILGMILAIPLTAIFIIAWRLGKNKYLNWLAEEHSASSLNQEQ